MEIELKNTILRNIIGLKANIEGNSVTQIGGTSSLTLIK